MPADGPEEMGLSERCLWYRGIPTFPTGYNNNHHILQTPDWVVILQEHIHDVRYIALDGRRVYLRTSISMRETRAAIGKAPRSSSKRPVSKRPSSDAGCVRRTRCLEVLSLKNCVWLNASRVSTLTRLTTSSPLTIRGRLRDRGRAHFPGRALRGRCTSSPVTRGTTAYGTYSLGLAPRNEPPRAGRTSHLAP